MAFNPTLPVDDSVIEAPELRGQFTGLFDLIQAVPAGPVGPPFTSFVIDTVTTLDPAAPATVTAVFDGTHVKLGFGIPRGVQGDDGEMPGWHVGPDGRIGIGTDALDDGASLTVDGGGNVSLHAEQVRLTSATGTPPSLTAAVEIGLQTDGGSSIFLRSAGATTEYTALSGTSVARSGHRFRTGSTPVTRMCIADDGVALDVPLRLQLCPLSTLPAAASCPGALLVIPDRAATYQLAYSDGLHWLILGSEDLI